jgi:hypothetical protein
LEPCGSLHFVLLGRAFRLRPCNTPC